MFYFICLKLTQEYRTNKGFSVTLTEVVEYEFFSFSLISFPALIWKTATI